MSIFSFIENLIEKKIIIIAVSVVLCFGLLGAHDLWTQEQRWVDIVSMMFLRDDFLHPYLGATPYYDKPLLSYWLIAAIVSVTHQLSTFTVRIPSAIFGMLGLYSAYRIAKQCYGKNAAFMYVWMFLSSFFYIFWARTASADILNVASVLFAISIYLAHRDKPSFSNLLAFFLVVSFASLLKGILAAVIVSIVVGIDVLLRGTVKRYVSYSFLAAFTLAAIVFCIPFMLSSYFTDANFIQNQNSGLYLVYKENVIRFLKPFDHKEPFYVYFLYLPMYLFPWIILFIPALINRIRSWPKLSLTSRWILLSFVALFVFFTLSGSRRSYYILPAVPFALLVILDWLGDMPRYIKPAKIIAIVMSLMLILFFMVMQPLFYHQYGTAAFLQKIIQHSTVTELTSENVVLFGVRSKLAFYLGMPPTAAHHSPKVIYNQIKQYELKYQEMHSLDVLPQVILTNKKYVQQIQEAFPTIYQMISPNTLLIRGKTISDSHEAIALVRRT